MTLAQPGKQTSRQTLYSDRTTNNSKHSQGKDSVADTEENSTILQDDIIRASESPALSAVREMLDLSRKAKDIYQNEVLESSGRDIGRRSLHPAEEMKPDEQSARISDGPGRDDVSVAALSPSDLVNPHSRGTHIEWSNDNGQSSPIVEKIILGSQNNVSTTVDTREASVPADENDHKFSPGGPSQNAHDSLALAQNVDLALDERDAVKTPIAKSPAKARESTRARRKAETPNAAEYSPTRLSTPIPTDVSKMHVAVPIEAETPGASPQIGTSLLRRESLRHRESPRKRRNLRKSRSPKRRNTLQRRDTLQEREILQRVIAEATPTQTMEDLTEGPVGVTSVVNTPPSLDFGVASEQAICKVTSCSDKQQLEVAAVGISESNLQSFRVGDGRDIERALEAIEVFNDAKRNGVAAISPEIKTSEVQTKEAINNANSKEQTAKPEIEHAIKSLEAGKEPMETPKRKTRSGARFSDDTSLLKEFLNRAQAKKAAKPPVLLAPDPPVPQLSPRRSPRKALGPHEGVAQSPQKPRDISHRPGTPPGTSKIDGDSDDLDEISAELASCRRSTRTRLPAPSKTPLGAPSFIPVRRADGTDPVVLQKSQAQELAIVTRANTRRNKGQSKPPLQALQDLQGETLEIATVAKARAEQAKRVGWAERLASYQDAKENTNEVDETRPKVRRVRGLGAGNGTPGPKRATAVIGSSNGTPAPKRRAKR